MLTKMVNLKNDNLWELTASIVPEKELQTLDVKEFVEEVVKMVKLYAKKNHDYGNSFEKGMNAIGLPYGVGRLFDKMNRILTLMKVKAEITDESIEDTIRDLACYSVMTSVYLNNCRQSLASANVEDAEFESEQINNSSTGELD